MRGAGVLPEPGWGVKPVRYQGLTLFGVWRFLLRLPRRVHASRATAIAFCAMRFLDARLFLYSSLLLPCACIEPTVSDDARDYADSWPARAPSDLEPGAEYIGRGTANPDGPVLAWPASMATVRFRGTGLEWNFTEQVAQTPSNYDIVVDGKVLASYLRTSAGDQRAELVSGLSNTEHEVSIVKRTEGAYGTTISRGFTPLGDGAAILAPPSKFPHKVMFVGDSITAGYGVLGASTDCAGDAVVQNARLSWASVFSRRVGAEAHLIAWSGKGLIRNLNRANPLLIPVIESRTTPLLEAAWDPAGFTPDLIVVNVGTNDIGSPNSDPGPAFGVAYQSYLRALLTRYPTAHIAAVLGPMISNADGLLDKMRRYVKAGATDVLRAEGKTSVHFVELNVQSPVDGYGCESHPSKRTAKIIARTLGRFAERELKWTWAE